MSGEYLFDTNVVIALFLGQDSVQQRVGKAHAIYVSGIVVGELYFGAYKSSKTTENLARIDSFLQTVDLLVCDEVTARHYGRIKQRLQAKGRPIPENDIWIAAIALQHGLTLVSRDAHFQEMENLSTQVW